MQKALAEVDEAEFLSFSIWSHLDSVLFIAQHDDKGGVHAALDQALKHCEIEKRAFETSMENVDKQQDFLENLIKESDDKVFFKVEEILDIYKQQSKVLFNGDLETEYQAVWNKLVNKKFDDAYVSLMQLTDKVSSFTTKQWAKITNVAE